MTKPFNFLQFGTGVEPFLSGLRSGFVEFYTPDDILSKITSGNFPLFTEELLYPTSFQINLKPNIKKDEIDLNNLNISFNGGFTPLIGEDSYLSSSLRSNLTGDLIDNPTFIANLSSFLTGNLLDTPVLAFNLNPNFTGVLIDAQTLISNLRPYLTGDNIENSNYSINFSGIFYQSLKDSKNLDFSLTDIIFAKGNILITDELDDNTILNFSVNRIIFSAGT